MNLNQILKKQIEIISVPKAEVSELNSLSKELISKISKHTNAEIKIGGSLAKQTLIKKVPQDIDIFIAFQSEKETENLKSILTKAKLKPKIVHGSRDYFQIINKADDTIFELIPVVKTKNPTKAENVTDVSLMHVKYVKNKIKANPKIADQIKLAKAFCYATNTYGAESYIKGFSGYSLEVLIIHYKTFAKFLKAISKLNKKSDKQILDPSKHFKSSRQVLTEINGAKLTSPIIIVDPTYKFRNITAGLSQETLDKFKTHAKKFLASPSLNAFKKKDINIDAIKIFAKKKKAKFFQLDLETEKQEGDIAGTKMKKFFTFLINRLNSLNQQVLKSEFDYQGKGQTAQAFLVINPQPEIIRRGPSTRMTEAAKAFKKANRHTKITEKNGILYKKEAIRLDEIFNSSEQIAEEMNVMFSLSE
jgi:tRNA CCA-adding enzyme